MSFTFIFDDLCKLRRSVFFANRRLPHGPRQRSHVATLFATVSKTALAVASLVTLYGSCANAADHAPAPIQAISLPPSADLHFKIKAQQSGLTLDGTAEVQWQTTGGKFSATSQSSAALLGKVLEAKSVGDIDGFGLAPASFNDKRFRKEPTITTFDRQAKTITFSASTASYPIQGGEQDRNSVIWQLISVARGAKNKFKAGSEWHFFVAGQRDAEPWTFKVINTEKLRTALGEVNAVHISRAPPPDAKGQRLDIWLAPGMEWYPARLRFTDPDGEYIEQTLESITKT